MDFKYGFPSCLESEWTESGDKVSCSYDKNMIFSSREVSFKQILPNIVLKLGVINNIKIAILFKLFQ